MAQSRPTVSGNLRDLQSQIHRATTAPPGPMSWGPEDGGPRVFDASGNTLWSADGVSGARVVSRGTLTSLTGLLDNIRAKDDQQDTRLGGHDTTLASHDSRISGLGDRMVSAEGRLDGHDTRLDAHNTRIHDNDSRISGLGDRMVTAEGTLSSHNTRINSAQARADNAHSDAATAQSRADSAYSRAGTALSNAATAQSRADSAHTRIDGLNYATPGQITTLSNAIQALDARIDSLEQWRASLGQ